MTTKLSRYLTLTCLAWIVCVLAIKPLRAADKTEEKLADAVAKANRQVTHAQEKAQEAGRKLNAHCVEKSKQAGIRQVDGLWGCIVIQPQPMNPPGTAR